MKYWKCKYVMNSIPYCMCCMIPAFVVNYPETWLRQALSLPNLCTCDCVSEEAWKPVNLCVPFVFSSSVCTLRRSCICVCVWRWNFFMILAQKCEHSFLTGLVFVCVYMCHWCLKRGGSCIHLSCEVLTCVPTAVLLVHIKSPVQTGSRRGS